MHPVWFQHGYFGCMEGVCHPLYWLMHRIVIPLFLPSICNNEHSTKARLPIGSQCLHFGETCFIAFMLNVVARTWA